jgi:Flp pilus assembly protein TadD
VALCIVGVGAAVITYRSQQRLHHAISQVASGRPGSKTLELAKSSQTLHPDTSANFVEALAAARAGHYTKAVAYVEDAARREPENAATWITLARLQVAGRRLAQARVSYARAKALDSQLPRTTYPP